MRVPYGRLLVLRLLLAVAIRTAFDPDEFWQGPEVAHRLVFGCALALRSEQSPATKRLAGAVHCIKQRQKQAWCVMTHT